MPPDVPSPGTANAPPPQPDAASVARESREAGYSIFSIIFWTLTRMRSKAWASIPISVVSLMPTGSLTSPALILSAALASVASAVRVVRGRAIMASPHLRQLRHLGLGLDRGIDSLARLYLSGLTGIGYGLRQLLDAFSDKGIVLDTLIAKSAAGNQPSVFAEITDDDIDNLFND